MAEKKTDISKRCKRCSLDCIIVRARTISNVPENHRQEAEMRMFSNTKPIYSRNHCPKIKKITSQQESNLTNVGKEPAKKEVKAVKELDLEVIEPVKESEIEKEAEVEPDIEPDVKSDTESDEEFWKPPEDEDAY